MLKTAEFAKMCHTTKDTLIFYDRIDVFKPAFVDSKKYRYYEVRQAVQFAFLSHLRDIGFSLEEIKEFIKRPNEEKFIKRLEERSEAFREEIEKAKRFLRYTDGILELSKEASRHVEGVISVERKSGLFNTHLFSSHAPSIRCGNIQTFFSSPDRMRQRRFPGVMSPTLKGTRTIGLSF